jgi:hypothetical protein
VDVLLLSWEEDDLGTSTEIEEVSSVFTEDYHFNAYRYLIPSRRPTFALQSFLSSFIRNRGDLRGLIILYYGGHSVIKVTEESQRVILVAYDATYPSTFVRRYNSR